MSSVAASLSLEELDQLLSRADPGAVLAPPRILRRVIRMHCKPAGTTIHVPHRSCFVLERSALLQIVEPDELALPQGQELPDTVLLLERPDPLWLARQEPGKVLRHYWRLLFHAQVHLALKNRQADGKLTPADVQARRLRIGTTEWAEIEAVLRQDHRLLPPGDTLTVYEEFAALYLELRAFELDALPDYFPSLESYAAIDALLALDVDADRLLARSRPEGADPASSESEEPGPAECPQDGTSPAREAYDLLCAQADQAHASGNAVRAAILRQQAVCVAPACLKATTRNAAEREIKQLVRRLRQALGGSASEADCWRRSLLALLPEAARGSWSGEARLLYDLQKVCVDQERDVWAVDVVEWLVSWGHKPIVRQLPHQQAVLTVKHLHRALHRLTGLRLSATVREDLEGLLREAVHDSAERLRQRLRPIFGTALEDVGLTPRCAAEFVARDRLIEELIDQVIERGYLNMSDLRDALARNRLKLPDLGGFREAVTQPTPSELSPARASGSVQSWLAAHVLQPVRGLPALGPLLWGILLWLQSVAIALFRLFLGDPLIQLNRRLAFRLDGVYRRGEIYLRFLQRLSSLTFGTTPGRLLTLYLIVPFGSSFMLLKFYDHVDDLIGLGGSAERMFSWAFPTLGCVFLLLHVRWFRRGLRSLALLAWRVLLVLCCDLPAAVLQWSPVQRILKSQLFDWALHYIGKPLVPALLTAIAIYLLRHRIEPAALAAAATFAAVCLLVSSRLGMQLEELAHDYLERTWLLIRVDVIAGLGRLILFLFKQLVEEVDRLLYAVDEWLRFRSGDSRLSLGVKLVLGLLWFLCTYLIRVIVNLFVEPTLNPIKHFPVVTVTAKLLLPFLREIIHETVGLLAPWVGKTVARMTAGAVVFLGPGLAGFIVWEFKENWRLYRANQSPTLDPEIVGHHGETVLRLLRPGLHSGTLPKLFARLRQSEGKRARRQQEALHQVEEAMQRFIRRSLLAVLERSPSWGDRIRLGVGHIHIGSNRLRLELCAPQAGSSVWIDFDEQGGWLLAGLHRPDPGCTWLVQLDEEQQVVLANALAGFYKLAGAQLVREQIEAALPSGTPYALTSGDLVVWPQGLFEHQVVYHLKSEGLLLPQGDHAVELRPLAREAVIFAATPVSWAEWCQVWEEDALGHPPQLLLAATALLPPLRLPQAACG